MTSTGILTTVQRFLHGPRCLGWALVMALGLLPLAECVQAAECGCGRAASRSSGGCGDGCERRPSGPIFKTLDTLAGGIETVLQKTVLNCNTSLFQGRSASATRGCDDACDAMMAESYSHAPASLVPLPPSDSSLAPLPAQRSVPQHSVERSVVPLRSGVPTLLPESGGAVSTSPPPVAGGRPRLIERPAESQPAAGLPQVPSDRSGRDRAVMTEDEWLDSFGPPQPRRVTPSVGNSHREVKGDPFQDDPQSRRFQGAGQELTLQPPANQVPQRKPLNTASFRGR